MGEDSPLKIDISVSSGLTVPLLHALRHGDWKSAKLELQMVSSLELVTIRDPNGRNALHYAAFVGLSRVYDVLFQHPIEKLKSEALLQSEVMSSRKQDIQRWGTAQDFNLYQEWIDSEGKRVTSAVQDQLTDIYYGWFTARDRYNRTFFHYMTRSKGVDLDSIFQRFKGCRKALTKCRSLINAKDSFNWSALQYAASYANTFAIKMLLRNGAGRGCSNDDIRDIIHASNDKFTRKVLLKEFEVVLEQSSMLALVDHRDNLNGSVGTLLKTPLHLAAESGDVQVIEALLDRGADVNVTDANCWSALHICAYHNHVAIARLLLSTAGISVNCRTLKGRTPLHIAAEQKKNQDENVTLTKLLLEYGSEIEARDLKGHTPFHLSCLRGCIRTAACLIESKCDISAVNHRGWNALHLACESGQTKIVRMLCRIDCEKKVLFNALNSQRKMPYNVAKDVRTREAMSNLWVAAMDGDYERVRHFIREAPHKNPTELWEPLTIADRVISSKKTALHLLLEGCGQSLRPFRSRTAQNSLQYHEICNRYVSVLEFLCKSGVDVETADQDGAIPLIYAAKYGLVDAMKILLKAADKESQVDHVDHQGNSALHYAYSFCYAKAARFLEDEEANPDLQNDRKQTPMDVAGLKTKLLKKIVV